MPPCCVLLVPFLTLPVLISTFVTLTLGTLCDLPVVALGLGAGTTELVNSEAKSGVSSLILLSSDVLCATVGAPTDRLRPLTLPLSSDLAFLVWYAQWKISRF